MATAAITVNGFAARPASGHIQNAGPAVNVTLDDGGVGGSSWQWVVVFAPSGTTAALSSAVAKTPTYGPLDLPGTYHLRLQVDGASGNWLTDAEVDEVVIRVREAAGVTVYIPAVEETTQAGAQGWAGETDGMNATLAYLTSLLTLQGAYDNSSPPAVTIGAGGPLQLLRNPAAHGANLYIGDTADTDRVAITSDGRVDLTAATITGAGEFALRVRPDAAAHASAYLASFEDQAGTSYVRVKTDGGLTVVTRAIAGFVFDMQDATTGGQLRMRADGQMEWSGVLAAGEEALKFTPLGIAFDSKIFEVNDGSNDAWAMFGDGRILHVPEELVLTTAADVTWADMDLSTVGTVVNGETRRGFRVDGSALTVDAGGVQVGFSADLRNNSGDAYCYEAIADVQDDVVAYRVATSAGGRFRAFARFSVADIGLHNWTGAPALSMSTGVANSLAAGNPSLFLTIPVRVPHGAVITNYSVHVNAGGAGIQATLVRTDATVGAASADQQTAIQASNAALGAGEVDLITSGFTETVPKQGAAAQYSYSIVVESAHAADVFYGGHVEYEYDELLEGS